MADKRISQLIERTNIANNDVLPIVASGATTTNKVTISTLQDWMQDNLDVGVTSVGLSMPSAFVVSASPVTSSGNISVTGAGTVAQYIRGDGSLADFPSGGGGGGASVNYYLNGSVSQGTIGGIAYLEMNKTPILGAGTDFTIAADGYIASFITDAGDPALLEIPGGNWNFETYFQASSGGGSPTFYVELYKVNSGGTATLIASNSANPELIAFGTTTTPYFSTLAVPTTTLALTDRLALRYYVTHSGRTITLHTENSNLCQIITTFTTGLTALNGLTAQVQNFATGTSGTDFAISSSVSTHTFNLPTASASNRGALSSSDWSSFNGKVPYTGAVASVDLGAYSITANAINSAGSGSTAGQINLRSDAFFSLVNGYGSIASGTTNQFNLYQTTGAGVFRCAILSLNSITASATRTFTFPDASGTLALTTDLSGYLPLTGGTLTGNLNGTTASFENGVNLARTSGNVGIGIDAGSEKLEVFSGSSRLVQKFRTSTNGLTTTYASANATVGFIGNGLGLFSTATETQFGIRSESDLLLGAGGGVRLTITAAGAATFSSSVGVGAAPTGTYGTLSVSGGISIKNDNSAKLEIGRYSVGVSNSYIKLGPSSNALIVTNNTDAADIFTILNGGNVGIGTASPNLSGGASGSTILTVSASTSARNAVLELNGTRTNSTDISGYVRFFNNGAATPLADIRAIRGSSDTSGDLAIETNGTERMRLALTGGDAYLRMSSSTGGIQFNGDTAAANALDDYEEGAFNPTIKGSTTSGTATYNARNGLYTKIGRMVTFNIYIDWNSGTGTGDLRLEGLPFVATSTGVYPGVTIGEISNITLSALTIATGRVQISTNEIYFNQAAVGGGPATSLLYDSAGYLVLTGTYNV